MEHVDIVDNNNNVIGKTAKKKAHSDGLLHRTVIAQVIDKSGRWTLVKQASDRQDAGQYVSPVGGHVTSGETEEEALKREAFEEMSIKDFTFKFIGRKIFNRTVIGRKENHYFILYEIFCDDEPTLNHESVSYEKFTKKELKDAIKKNPKDFGEAFYFILKNFYPELLAE